MTPARPMASGAPRCVHPARRSVYEKAGDLASLADEAASMARHAGTARALATLGEAALARGAVQVATVTALRLATTSARTRREHEAKVDALVDFVAATREPDRAHVASLLDVALWAEAEQRLSVGLRPHASRSIASMIGVDVRTAEDVQPHHDKITADDRTRYVEAEAARDVDVVLSTTIGVLRDLVVLPKAERAAAGAWAIVEGAAFGLCVRPTASADERHDVRRTLLILWRTLRRRRPAAAAVLRRRLALDRARWPGPVR